MENLNPRMLILRGFLSFAFGVLAFLWPGPGLLTIALMYGAYAFLDGVTAIGVGFKRERAEQSWGLPVFEGVLGVAVGVMTLLWPGITVLALSIFVGFWAIATGILEVSAAFKLGKVFADASQLGRVLLGLAGVASIVLGVVIFMTPAIGALALLTLVASYALVFGVLMVSLGFKLRNLRNVRKEEVELPMKKAA